MHEGLRVLTLLHFATAGPGIATAVNQHREDAGCRNSRVHSSSAVCRECVLSACSLAQSALRSGAQGGKSYNGGRHSENGHQEPLYPGVRVHNWCNCRELVWHIWQMQNASFKEIRPTCCLDFYVHFSCQRCGIGKKMFEHMLEA